MLLLLLLHHHPNSKNKHQKNLLPICANNRDLDPRLQARQSSLA